MVSTPSTPSVSRANRAGRRSLPGASDSRLGTTVPRFLFAAIVVAVMSVGQSVTQIGVRERPIVVDTRRRTSARHFARAIARHDQLLDVAIAMLAVMIGHTTMVSLFCLRYVVSAWRQST